MSSFPISLINRVIHRLSELELRGPLSARTVVILLCLLYLFLGPIRNSTDIVSAAMAYGIMGTTLLIALYVIGHGLLIRRRVKITLAAFSGDLVAGESTPILVESAPFRILPLLTLKVSLPWKQGDLPKSHVLFSGRGKQSRRGIVNLSFPHRGIWKAAPLICTYSDFLGLIQVKWSIACDFSVHVAPPLCFEANLPIISSSQRPGDLATDTLNREGDHYDLKRYHPSDGVKKIVWKVFAKRGELLSRHPEASITPEGYILIFVCARKHDDDVVARAVSYVDMVCDLQIDVSATCEGAPQGEIAHNAGELKELAIETVWDAETKNSLINGLQSLLSSSVSRSENSRIEKVVLFCSDRRLSTPEGIAAIEGALRWLTDQGIAPVIVMSQSLASESNSTSFGSTHFVKSIFISTPTSGHAISTPSRYSEFVSTCLKNQWEVLI
jgi:hypothetical protein